MVKKVFAIIGIVVGSVTAFVGAVFGVMAAMGKFKTPVVWPKVLEFVDNGQVVIAGVPNGLLDKEPTIHFFTLKGTNSSMDHEVNKKVCYVWFDIGADLITLCDKNGNPLVPTENNRYKVNCNEPIYYTTNPIKDDAVTDGKVVLMARSANDKIQPNDPMTIWIDREVDEGIFVEGWGEPLTEDGENTQNISLGVDIEFDFNYVVGIDDVTTSDNEAIKDENSLALKPISKESAKEIELYYVATGYSTDYIKVTEAEINNPESPLNDIMTFKDGVFSFKSTEAGNHTFKIAVFKTYEYKSEYLASVEGLTLTNPNFDKLTSLNSQMTSNMTVTTVNVNVENIDISKVGFLSSNVVLNLYSENDYITLDGISGVTGAKDNNLELFMKKGEGANEVLDYTRFDEVKMIDFSTADVWTDKKPEFVSLTGTTLEVAVLESLLKDSDKTNDISTIKLSNDLNIIDYVSYNGTSYFSNNGVAVYDTNKKEVKVLATGSYLNFYTEDMEGIREISSIKYSAEVSGKGKSKSWNIVSKSMPLEGEELKLGILVVNSKGRFYVDNFFASVPVNLNEVPLTHKFETYKEDLDITFSADKVNYDDSAIDFEDIVTISGGSYNACVFVIDVTDNSENCIVDTIPNITYIEGTKTYALVGYKDKDGNFVNKVRVNSNVSSKNKSCQIVMLQLKNGHDEDVYDIIDAETLTSGITFDKNGVVKLYDDETVTINSTYILNKDLLNIKYYDTYNNENSEENVESALIEDGYSVYEHTDNHKIVITSTNSEMLTKVSEFYSFETEYNSLIYVSYDNKLEFISADESNNIIIITYDVETSLNDESIPIRLTLVDLGVDVDMPKLYILSGSPKNIVFNAEEIDESNKTTHQLYLTTKENAENVSNNNYLKVKVSYEEGNFKYLYYLSVNGHEVQVDMESIFNENISSSTEVLFQDEVDKGQTLPIAYDSLDKSIFNSDLISTKLTRAVGKSGSTVLAVTIGKTTQYVKLVTDTNDFSVATVGDKLTFENTNATPYNTLRSMVEFKFGTQLIDLIPNNMVYIENVKSISYGDGTLVVAGDKENGWELKKEIGREVVDGQEKITYEPVLNIKPSAEDWGFDKKNAYIPLTISFDVATIAGTKSIQLRFTPSISVEVNENWTKNRVLYAGTKVMLASSVAETCPVFDINADGNDFKIKINGVEVANTSEYEVPDTLIGTDLVIEILINDISIKPFYDFVVKPNVVATLKTNNIESETIYSIIDDTKNDLKGVYILKAFDTDITYGNSLDKLYTSLDEGLSSLKNLTGTVDSSVLSFGLNAKETNENPVLTAGDKLNVGEIVELQLNPSKQREIYLVYTNISTGNIYIVEKSTINIINKYDSALTVEPTGEGVTKTFTYKAKKLYDVFAKMATDSGFSLVSVEADNLTFKFSEDKTQFYIDNFITQNLTGVDVLVTFEKVINENTTQTVTCALKINIIPYTPEENKTITPAFSGASYDLLTSRYAEATLIADSNVEKLLITGMKDVSGKSITSEIIKGEYVASGYIKGNALNHCAVEFNEIKGEDTTIVVEYELTYIGGEVVYTFTRELTITNRQKIIVQYPESDLKLDRGTFKFFDDYKEDGRKLSEQAEISNDGIYTLTNVQYEPMLIYTDEPYILDFNNDTNKKLSRIIVENEEKASTTNSTSTTPTITLIGYENNFGMSDYVQRVNDKYNTNQVYFGTAAQGMFGTLVFKIESVSGYVKYYLVYVYCKGLSTAVNVENNLKIVAYQDGIAYASNYKNNNVQQIKIDETTTLDSLVQTVLTLEKDVDSKNVNVFNTIFNRTYGENTSLYLLDVTSTGTAYDYQGKHWKKVGADDKIVLSSQYNTITLGLLYSKGVERYTYGTITIYAQPTNPVIPNSLDYDVPNGYFSKPVQPKESSISNPFTTGVTTVIIQADGLEEQGYKLVDGVIVNKNLVVVEGKSVEDDDKIIYINGSEVVLNKKVATDLIFVVRYEFGGTVAFVTYTFGATVLPKQAELNNSPIEIGQFSVADGFKDTIDLDATAEQIEKYFGTYDISKGFTTTFASGANVKVNESDNTILEFTQTHETQTIKVTITYTTYIPAQDDNNTREFTFIVLPGVYLDDTSTADNTGLSDSDSKRKVTDKTGDYTKEVGSTLSFNYYSKTDDLDDIIGNGNDTRDYYTYVVGGLKIYTAHESELTLTFDEINYVVNTTDGKCNIDSTATVDFVHTPQDIAATMTINVVKSDDNEEYASRNLYLKIAKTYTALQTNYLADGADHENVLSGEDNRIENLHETMFGTSSANSRRIKLLGLDFDNATGKYKEVPTYNFDAMGFTRKTNPNFIKFEVGDNANLRTYGTDPDTTTGIIFKAVTINSMCALTLNNLSGMPEIVYNYQIMARDSVDGLDYSDSTANYDTYDKSGTEQEYISILLDDTTNTTNNAFTSKKIVLGSGYDLKNKGVFTVSSFAINTTPYDSIPNPKVIEEGKYKEEPTTKVIGGYINAIQYIFEYRPELTTLKYTFYLTYDIDYKTLDLIVARASGQAKENFVLTLSAGGVNGGETLIKDLEIALNNFTVYSKFEDTVDTAIYSGYLIDLSEKFVEADLTTAGQKLDYELAESTYILEGKQYTIKPGEVDNDLFTFINTDVKKAIQTKAVGSNVLASIVFKVKRNNYVLKNITYRFNIYVNMQFVVNGHDLVDNIDNSNPETYFILTNKEKASDTDFSNFELTKNFIAKSEIILEGENKNVDGTYYNVLAFDLYRRKLQGNASATEKDLIMSRDSVVVELYSNISSDILTVNNTGITFYKDYTGDIELKLSVKTDNGTYYVIWTIYVTGILNINYSVPDHEFARLQDNALPFNSGREVDLIYGSTNGDGVAVTMTASSRFNDYLKYGEINAYYEYKIITFNNETRAMSNEELFNIDVKSDLYKNSFKGSGKDKSKISDSTLNLAINLPGVPSTTEHIAQSYFVTYKVYVEYLGLTYDANPVKNKVKVFYVTYEVINYQTIDIYTTTSGMSSTNVNVDSLTDNKLDLFYYDETYTVTTKQDGGTEITTTYKFTYENGTIKLTIDNSSEYIYDSTTEQFKVPSSEGSESYKYNTANKTLEQIGTSENTLISGGTWNVVKDTNNLYPNPTVFTFKTDFANIFEYKNFIDIYLGKTKTKENQETEENNSYIALTYESTEYAFTLVYNDDTGAYGINLAENINTSDDILENDVLFSNDMKAELALIENGVKTMVVDPYTDANTSGFRLFTSNSITANTNNGAGIRLSTMFLPSYFTRNSTIENNNITINDSIIGVGTPDGTWVNQGTADLDEDSETYATILIPNGEIDENPYNTYEIKRVKYTYTPLVPAGTDLIYNLEQWFYYISLDTTSSLVVPDYNAVGIETTFFKITYIPGQQYQELDLTKAVKTWSMTSTSDSSKVELTSDPAITVDLESTTNANLSKVDSKLVIDSEVLDTHKAQYPNAKNYGTITAVVKAGVYLKFNIVFALYDYVKTEVDFDATSSETELKVDLKDKIYIPVLNNSKVEYKVLGENLSKINSVVEKSTNYSVYDNGVLKLSVENVKEYFRLNPTSDKLVITYTLTTTEGNTLNFQVFVNITTQTDGTT